MTREKIRSLGSKPCFATEATIFSTGRDPVLGNEVLVEKISDRTPIKNVQKVFEEREKLFSKSFSQKILAKTKSSHKKHTKWGLFEKAP